MRDWLDENLDWLVPVSMFFFVVGGIFAVIIIIALKQ